MARLLKVKVKQADDIPITQQLDYVATGNKDLTFFLDSQETVTAERAVMSASSSVFAAMLEGHFSESSQSQVRIAKVKKVPLELTVAYLHGNHSWLQRLSSETAKQSELDQNEASTSSINIDTALMILELSDRFMLHGLQQKLSDAVCHCLMNSDNVQCIMKFAVMHHERELARQCVCYVLGAKMGYRERVEIGKRLMEQRDREVFVGVVEEVLADLL